MCAQVRKTIVINIKISTNTTNQYIRTPGQILAWLLVYYIMVCFTYACRLNEMVVGTMIYHDMDNTLLHFICRLSSCEQVECPLVF